MSNALALKMNTHVVDILGNVRGRDQPIMLIEKALDLVNTLGYETLLEDNIIFFDPFCKAGEILLACAIARCLRKSLKNSVVDIDFVKKELYESNRYYALAPDERHHRLSLRTFLGNKNSHNKNYQKIIKNGNYLSEIDGKLNETTYREELSNMIEYIKKQTQNKRIIAVGNPPYHESDGGFGASSTSIYGFFAESLIDCKEISEFVLVIPSRWFAAGKGVDQFRERILNSKTIKTIQHFQQSKMVFPTVEIEGGICFLHYQAHYNGKMTFIHGNQSSKVDISKHDIILDDPRAYSLVDKIKRWEGEFVSSIAWSRKPFGISTDYFKKNQSLAPKHKKSVPCFSNRRQIQYANIDDVTKNKDKIDEWQVAVPKAYGGSRFLPNHQFFIIPKGHITTETYTVIGSFKFKNEADNFLKYLKTSFSRFFLGLRKVTQDIPKNRWSWVPLLDQRKEWTDEMLFKKFKISKKEQKYIEKKLKEWS